MKSLNIGLISAGSVCLALGLVLLWKDAKDRNTQSSTRYDHLKDWGIGISIIGAALLATGL